MEELHPLVAAVGAPVLFGHPEGVLAGVGGVHGRVGQVAGDGDGEGILGSLTKPFRSK